MDLMNAQVRTQALTNQQTLTMDHTGSTSASSAAQMLGHYQKLLNHFQQSMQTVESLFTIMEEQQQQLNKQKLEISDLAFKTHIH